jgi:hypothetical protein
MTDASWSPVTFENSAHVPGPFYHGTKATLAVGDLLSPGHASNYDTGRTLHHIYFSALLEPAVWGAELSAAFAGRPSRGHIYLVEPTGPFEDDPNLTNKRFPGNPTRSYRSRAPLKIIGAVQEWQGHSEEMVQAMLQSLRELTRRGENVIED